MPTTTIQETRRAALDAFVAELCKVRDDSDALEGARRGDDLPQYAASSYDGTACWVSVHETLTDAADYLAGEAQGEIPWAPGEVIDLDTGHTWGARAHVELTPATTQPENTGPIARSWELARGPEPSTDTAEDYVEIYAVRVEGRMDGLYLFDDDEIAGQFADAVETTGGSVERTNEPLNGPVSAQTLIDAELSDA